MVVLARGQLVVRLDQNNPYLKCPKYWRGCFECKYYLGFGYVKFCRAYNMKKFGAEIVEEVIETTPEEEERLVTQWVRKQQ